MNNQLERLIAKLCDADNRHKSADKVLVHNLNDWYVTITQLDTNDQIVYNKDRKGKL